jgi:CDP-4-dehydro-6-deoxyglucose reductase
MAFSVTVQPSGHQFQVEEHQTVLAAALAAGVGLPYGCRNGACGSCKGQVVSGTFDHDVHQASALSAEEKAEGKALFCCAHARSDLTIEVREIRGVGDIAIRKMPCRVASVERVAPDVVVVKLQLPAAERFQYLAGQYVELILKDGKRRSYSMASAPHLADQLELHIRHMPGGAFTDQIFADPPTQMRVRDIIRFEGPLGTFFLREDSDKPMVLLASGTGFAPIKALLEHCVLKRIDRPIVLYWGGRRPHDLYMTDVLEGIGAQLTDFRFVPVVSDATFEDRWSGRIGFVHRAVMEDIKDLSGHQVYVCGAPVVVDSARRDFVNQCGLPAEEFYADSFTTEADLAREPIA